MAAPGSAIFEKPAADSRSSLGKRLYSKPRIPWPRAAFKPFAPLIIHTANSFIVTDGSLSTFDRFVSCLYFFESE
jgi:hypothetical protein